MTLKGFQKRYLRGLAHGLKPTVLVGQNGLTPALVHALDGELLLHELMKLKFIDFKEKEEKAAVIESLSEKTGCDFVGLIGHTAILYRTHPEPEKRKIALPDRTSQS